MGQAEQLTEDVFVCILLLNSHFKSDCRNPGEYQRRGKTAEWARFGRFLSLTGNNPVRLSSQCVHISSPLYSHLSTCLSCPISTYPSSPLTSLLSISLHLSVTASLKIEILLHFSIFSFLFFSFHFRIFKKIIFFVSHLPCLQGVGYLCVYEEIFSIFRTQRSHAIRDE